jgi:hypothetical protein
LFNSQYLLEYRNLINHGQQQQFERRIITQRNIPGITNTRLVLAWCAIVAHVPKNNALRNLTTSKLDVDYYNSQCQDKSGVLLLDRIANL